MIQSFVYSKGLGDLDIYSNFSFIDSPEDLMEKSLLYWQDFFESNSNLHIGRYLKQIFDAPNDTYVEKLQALISSETKLAVGTFDLNLFTNDINFTNISPEAYLIFLKKTIWLLPKEDNVLPIILIDADSVKDLLPEVRSLIDKKGILCDRQGTAYSSPLQYITINALYSFR